MKIPSKTGQAGAAPPANVLNVEELCEYLQISPVTVYRMLKRRNLPGFRTLGNWRFNIEDVNRLMKEGAGSARQSNEREKLAEIKDTAAARTTHEEEIKAKRKLLIAEMDRYFRQLSIELRDKWGKVSLRLGPELAALSLGSVLASEVAGRAARRRTGSSEPRQESEIARGAGVGRDLSEKLLNGELMILASLNRSMEALGRRLDELQER